MRNNVLYYITGFSVVIAFLWCIWILAYHDIPEKNRELFIHILGIIDGAFVGGMVASFFGSSKRDHEATSPPAAPTEQPQQ
jgi:hypothetical protein